MPWQQLKAIADANRQQIAAYNALPPDACPLCGSPLDVGTQTQAGGGQLTIRHCPMGHYEFSGGRRLT